MDRSMSSNQSSHIAISLDMDRSIQVYLRTWTGPFNQQVSLYQESHLSRKNMMETTNGIAAAACVTNSSDSFPTVFPAKHLAESRRSHYLSTDQHTLPQKEYMLNLMQ